MDVHVSWSLVGLNQVAEAASRTNQTEDVAKAGEARDAAEAELEAWFPANDGKYLSGGEPGRAAFALDHLEDFRQFLTRLRQTYGLVAAGLGMDSKEADLALQVCQTRGSRVEVVWSPNHADEIRKSLLEDFVADFPVAGGPEALEKKISGISPGTLTEPDKYDYSHVLPQGHRNAGYSMSVLHLPWKDEEDPGSTHFDTILHHQGQEVGSVSSRVRDGALHIDNTTINGKLDPSGAFAHRGKRLGVSMYAATMAHSHHLLGAKRTLGGVHSTSASRTHQSLARDHGLDYRPVKIDDNPVGDKDANYGPYEYALKSELAKAENAPRDAPAATPEQSSTSSVPQTFEQQFHAAAQAQEQIDRDRAQRDEIQRGQLLGQVAQVLRMVQGQAHKLEELRQAAPEVYQAVKAMAQAVAQMAQGLRGDGESMRKAEEWLTRPPDVLAKMARIHDNVDVPMYVYRIQDDAGDGPARGPKLDELGSVRRLSPTGLTGNSGGRYTPTQDFDFEDQSEMKLNDYSNPHLFGFLNENDHKKWYYPHHLQELHKLGYQLWRVPAKKVWLSESGKQVVFVPHEDHDGPFGEPHAELGHGEMTFRDGFPTLDSFEQQCRCDGRGCRICDYTGVIPSNPYEEEAFDMMGHTYRPPEPEEDGGEDLEQEDEYSGGFGNLDGKPFGKAEEWLTRPPLMKGHYDKLLTEKGMKLRAAGADPFTPAQAVHGHDAWNHQFDCQDRGCNGCLTQQDKVHGSSTGWQHATDCTDKGCGGACTERSQLMPAEDGPWHGADVPDEVHHINTERRNPWRRAGVPGGDLPPSGHRWRVWDFSEMLPRLRSTAKHHGLRLEVHHNPHVNTMKAVLLAPPSSSRGDVLPVYSSIDIARPLRSGLFQGDDYEHYVIGQKTIPLTPEEHWRRSAEISKKAMSPLMRERYGKIMDTVLQHVMANRKDVVKSEQLDKNLSSIPPGKPLPKTSLSNAKEYDYSHLLPESQRHMKLVVRDHGLAVGRKTDAHPHYTAHVLDDSKEAGSVQAHLYDGFVGRRHMEMHAPFGLVREYQGRGLGSSMYEALQAHGVQHGRVTHVTGGGHTDAAGKVHERLAARHGFRYRPRAGGEFNDRGPYKYAVKSVVEQFDLVKMALQPRIAGRRQTGENEWDYSHLLPAHHRNQFRLIVRDRLPEEDDSETPPRSMAHLVVRPGSEVARILAGDRLFPHTDEYSVGHVGGVHIGKQGLSVAREASTAAHLHPMLRNNGLGKALYSALYTHALALGRPHVAGSGHSEEAGRVHESLAREHGFEYDAERGDDGRGSYGYTLKSEDTGPMRLTKAFSGLPLPRLNRRVNLRLPVGTWDATSGRIKIRKPDGSEVWHQAKVGLIASSSPATAGADFGNPTSARNPSG